MSKLRFKISLSLESHVAGRHQSVLNSLGPDGGEVNETTRFSGETTHDQLTPKRFLEQG